MITPQRHTLQPLTESSLTYMELGRIKNAQDKLEQYYYERMQESPAYAASVVLNPQHKRHWFNFHWKANRLDWIEEAQQNVKCLWLTNYKDIQSRDEPSSAIQSTQDRDIICIISPPLKGSFSFGISDDEETADDLTYDIVAREGVSIIRD